MADQTDKVVAGQQWAPPGATLFNEFVQAAIDRHEEPIELPTEYRGRNGRPFTEIRILFPTDINAYTVVGYGDPVLKVTTLDEAISVADDRVVLEEQPPASARWAVCQKGTSATDEVRQCVRFGQTWVQAEVLEQSHGFVEVDNGDNQLKSATEGTGRILYKPNASGVQWVYVEICCYGGAATEQPCEFVDPANPLPNPLPVTLGGITDGASTPGTAALLNGTHNLPISQINFCWREMNLPGLSGDPADVFTLRFRTLAIGQIDFLMVNEASSPFAHTMTSQSAPALTNGKIDGTQAYTDFANTGVSQSEAGPGVVKIFPDLTNLTVKIN